jgi:hypothetical protein
MTAQTTQRVSVTKARKRRGLKGLFITGLIFILPLYITWILVKLVVAWLKDLLHDTFSLLFRLTFGNFLGEYYARIEWVFLFLIGLPIVLAFIIIVGWAAQNLMGGEHREENPPARRHLLRLAPARRHGLPQGEGELQARGHGGVPPEGVLGDGLRDGGELPQDSPDPR